MTYYYGNTRQSKGIMQGPPQGWERERQLQSWSTWSSTGEAGRENREKNLAQASLH